MAVLRREKTEKPADCVPVASKGCTDLHGNIEIKKGYRTNAAVCMLPLIYTLLSRILIVTASNAQVLYLGVAIFRIFSSKIPKF